MDRVKAIANAIKIVGSDLTVSRKDEDLFGVLFASHLIGNGGPEVKPDILILSLRDAFCEYSLIKENIKNPTIENVFTKKYIQKLVDRGWIQFNKHRDCYMI